MTRFSPPCQTEGDDTCERDTAHGATGRTGIGSISRFTRCWWLIPESNQPDWECKNPASSAGCEGKEGCQHWDCWFWQLMSPALGREMATTLRLSHLASPGPHHAPQPLLRPPPHCPLPQSKGRFRSRENATVTPPKPNALPTAGTPVSRGGMLPITRASGRTQKRF